MRRLLILILFILPAFVFGQGGKILARHLEKYGQSTWSQIETLKILGKHVEEDYSAHPISIINKENKQVQVESKSSAQHSIFTLDHEVFRTSGLETSYLPLYKLILQHALTIGSPIAKFRNELTFYGLEVLEGTTFFSFKKEHDDYIINYLIDKETDELNHMLLQVEGKDPMKARLDFDTYKLHHGQLLMPTAIVIHFEGEFKEWVFDEILLGIAIDEKAFLEAKSQ